MEVSELNNNFEFNSFIYDTCNSLENYDLFNLPLNKFTVRFRESDSGFGKAILLTIRINGMWVVNFNQCYTEKDIINDKHYPRDELYMRANETMSNLIKEAIRRERIRRNPASEILKQILGE